MTFPAFLFDYNGVLVDDEDVHWAAFGQVLRPMGIEISRADYWEKYLGFDDVGAFRAVLANHGRPVVDSEVQALVERKKPVYLELARDTLKGFDGSGALLLRLARAGATIGIVSGALRDEIALGLEVLGATSAVKFIVSAEDTRASKPDPEGYLIGKQRLAALRGPDVTARALVIEDSLAGIEAALGAGLSCLAVAHSYDRAQLVAAGALHVVDRIADVDDALLAQLYAKAGAN
jgi:beta-phosphoglucomutase-like phosphatase (HAD superfamily)